jgi:RNA polymerase sigma-32 factor
MDITYQAALKEPIITREAEVEAITRWQEEAHQPSLELLVRSHARMAYSTAYKYASNPEHVRDLAAQGMIGLMTAATKFSLDKGTRFATYARWWVLTEITNNLSQVTAQIDLPARTFMDVRRGKAEGGDKDRAHMAVFGAQHLDAPISSEDESMTAMDYLVCPKPTPEQATEQNSNAAYFEEKLAKAMSVLTDREKDIVTRRKLAPVPETLEEISADIGVTRERVRQIESRALGKLKRALTELGFSLSMLRE